MGRMYDAEQAYEMGLVNLVVPDDELEAEVDRWVEELAARSPTSLRLVKVALNSAADALRGAANHEALLVSTTAGSERYRAEVHEFFDSAQRSAAVPCLATAGHEEPVIHVAEGGDRLHGNVRAAILTARRPPSPRSPADVRAPRPRSEQDGSRGDRHDQPVPRARRGDDEGHGGRRRAHRRLPRPHLRHRRSRPPPAARHQPRRRPPSRVRQRRLLRARLQRLRAADADELSGVERGSSARGTWPSSARSRWHRRT